MKALRAIAWGIALLAATAYAGRPLTIDDAEPVDKGHFQFKAGVRYDRLPDGNNWSAPGELTYGMIENLEVSIGVGGRIAGLPSATGVSDNEPHVSDVGLGAKWRFLKQDQFLVDQALSIGAVFPTRSEDGFNRYGAAWVVSRQVTEKLAMDFNLAYTWIANTQSSDTVVYGAAIRYQLTPTLQPVAEIFSENPLSGPDGPAVVVNAGIRWAVAGNLTLDASAGTGLTDEAPDLIVKAGLTWNF